MRGKKTPPETIYAIMAVNAITNNLSETSRMLNVPVSTVEDIVKEHENDEEFAKLRKNVKNDFVNKATGIIEKAVALLDRRFERALEEEDELDALIEEIRNADQAELTREEKNRLYTKIRSLQLYDIKAVSSTLSTLYDRRALALGESTENAKITFELPKELDDFAG